MEILLSLGIVLAVSLAINIVMFIPAFIWKTDTFTDISYAVTFVIVGIFGFLTSDKNTLSILLLILILVWAFRLGTYLFIRIRKIGKDARFDGMREHFWKFLKFWILQGITVFVVMIAATIGFSHGGDSLSWISLLGVIIFIKGLTIETIADIQKYRFINNPKNQGAWIASGVWKYSRHPNYFGEIQVWVGIYLVIAPVLIGWEYIIALASPLFIAGMIIFVSGIPLLEKSADAKWGDNPRYQEYKRKTSILVPWFFKK